MKKILLFLIIVISLIIINNLGNSIYHLWQKNDLLTKAEKELAEAKKEHTKLVHEAKQVKKPSFVEEEARNKLFFAKPGEHIVILPEKEKKVIAAVKPVEKPNWKQWWELFF